MAQSNVCPCGATFQTTPSRIADGRGRYCSRACMYRFRVRPKGLAYRITKPNPGWWSATNPPPSGDKSGPWKGDAVGYAQLHDWIRQQKGKPGPCAHCGAAKTLWANVSREYRRDLNDWMALCSKCHHAYDREGDNWGKATDRFGRGVVQGLGSRHN